MERKNTVGRTATIVGAVVVIGVIIWIDIATGLWQNLVILAGLAAGLVSFLLTTLVLDRVMARHQARRWAPLNRLALSEFMHAMADEDASEISRGHIVMRSLPEVQSPLGSERLHQELSELREQVVSEREQLAVALSMWAEFLTSSGDNETILNHAAGIALRLDEVRDATVAVEREGSEETLAELRREIDNCNHHFATMAQELHSRLEEERRLLGRHLYGGGD
ncbi:hypothetical protein AADG42_14715 [Ammonicoccus fulvus]|uniref:Uncharacterized protein n=1 Tax=Ammonicoccus fulvus TaxID=3138240 RepID=A0ABZ3FUX3_9ACTN